MIQSLRQAHWRRWLGLALLLPLLLALVILLRPAPDLAHPLARPDDTGLLDDTDSRSP